MSLFFTPSGFPSSYSVPVFSDDATSFLPLFLDGDMLVFFRDYVRPLSFSRFALPLYFLFAAFTLFLGFNLVGDKNTSVPFFGHCKIILFLPFFFVALDALSPPCLLCVFFFGLVLALAPFSLVTSGDRVLSMFASRSRTPLCYSFRTH